MVVDGWLYSRMSATADRRDGVNVDRRRSVADDGRCWSGDGRCSRRSRAGLSLKALPAAGRSLPCGGWSMTVIRLPDRIRSPVRTGLDGDRRSLRRFVERPSVFETERPSAAAVEPV